MLENLVNYNAPLYIENLRQAVSKVMEGTEEEERNAEHNANNVTMDTFYHQSPITANTQGEISNVKNDRQIPNTANFSCVAKPRRK